MTEDEFIERVARRLRAFYSDEPIEVCDGVAFKAARAVISEVLEEAVMVCEDLETELWKKWKGHYNMLDQGRSDGAGDCAEALRAMIPKREGD